MPGQQMPLKLLLPAAEKLLSELQNHCFSQMTQYGACLQAFAGILREAFQASENSELRQIRLDFKDTILTIM